MNQTLPDGWASTTLGDLSTYVTSGSRDWSKFYAETGALFVRTQDINRNRLSRFEDIARVALPEHVEGKRTLIVQGDLLITITGANVGKCALVSMPIPEAYVSQSVALVRPVQGFDSRFVQWQLISPSSEDERTTLQQSAYGVGRPVLNLDNVKGVSISLAPLNEQVRIVDEIEQLMARVKSADDSLSSVSLILKRLRGATLAAACAGTLTEDWREKHPLSEPLADVLARVLMERKREFQTQCAKAKATGHRIPPKPYNLEQLEYVLPEPLMLPEIPDGWVWVSVNDVTLMAQYGTSVRADGTPKGGVPLLRMGNIQDGQLDLTDLQYITKQVENIDDFKVARGDILFNRTNSPELVGKSAIYDCGMEAVFASYLIRLRCDARIAVGQYLSSWLNSPWGRWWARTVRTDGVSQSNINATKLRSMPMPLPPLQEQVEIVRRIKALFALGANIKQSVQAAQRQTEKLGQAILAKAFRGELVPTEDELARREGRDYEPASVLLEKIKTERASAEREKLRGVQRASPRKASTKSLVV